MSYVSDATVDGMSPPFCATCGSPTIGFDPACTKDASHDVATGPFDAITGSARTVEQARKEFPPRVAPVEQQALAGLLGHCDTCGAPTDKAECVDCQAWGEPCQSCGERGQMKGGDPDDCRSPDCLSSKCDAAMDALEDR